MSEPLPSTRSDTVLAIDDDPNCLELMTRALTRLGVNVITASCGEDGLRLAQEWRPLAIFLDVVMPDLDGWTVLSRLKADPQLHSTPVVIVTMLDERKKGLALGVTNYLLKPVNRIQLATLIQQFRQTPEPFPCPGPRSDDARVPTASPAPERPAREERSEEEERPILIVEDDTTNREILARLLRRQGLSVLEADNGQLALQRIEERPPSLIILDLMMPVMDGLSFVQALRQHPEHHAIPVLILTAKELSPSERERLGEPICRVLQKGACRREDLLREISACRGTLQTAESSRT
jgi:CheY-like chemotaxis protein